MYTKRQVKDYYNKSFNMKRYGEAIDKSGLWNSEKLIFAKYVKNNIEI